MKQGIWLLVMLDEGSYLGVEEAFKTKEEACRYARNLDYVDATEDEMPYYGIIDFVDVDNPAYRLVLINVDMDIDC